jgi:hypothetical protein
VSEELELSPIALSLQQVRLVDFLDQLLTANNELYLVVILDSLERLPESETRSLLEQIRVVSESREGNRLLKRALFVLGGQCLDLRRLDPERTSPFNIAERIFLGDLDDQASLALAHNLLKQAGRQYSELATKSICHLTGNHPYLLERICLHLTHDTLSVAATESGIDLETIDRVVQTMCDDGRDRLLRQVVSTLGELSPSALECLRNILNGARYDSKKESPTLRELARLGLISSSKGTVWQVRNSVLDRYLRRQTRLAPVLRSEWLMPRRLYANVEGYKILYELENDLRDFVYCKIVERFPDSWQERVDQSITDYCQKKKKTELESGWFPSEHLPDLAYSLFPHLKQIIEENWGSIFHRYFKPKTIFTGYFHKLESIRNRIAHNRPLTDREVEQLVMIATQFRDCMYDVLPGSPGDAGAGG